MKIALAILAVMGVVAPLSAYKLPVAGNGELARELQEIVDVIPLDKVLEITKEYLRIDKQFQAMFALVKSYESQQLMEDITKKPELSELLNYIQSLGLDVYYLWNKLLEGINLPPIQPLSTVDVEISGGIAGYFQDVSAVLPINEILKLIRYKLEHSEVVANLYRKLVEPRYLVFYQWILQDIHFLNLTAAAARENVVGQNFLNSYGVLLGVAAMKIQV